MLTFNAHFQRLSEVTLSDLMKQPHGVYILWNAKATVRMSYIGEGQVAERVLKHDRSAPWSGSDMNGLVALFDGTDKEAKAKAEAWEELLLYVAKRTNRSPTHNIKAGNRTGRHLLDRRSRRANQVMRYTITGFDPLTAPTTPRLRSPKKVEFDLSPEQEWIHRRLPWRMAA